MSAVLILALLGGLFLPFAAPTRAADPVDDLLARMTLEQKVGQLFIVRFWGQEANAAFGQLAEVIQPGGVVLIKENLRGLSPEGIAGLTRGLQRMALSRDPAIPLFIAADQESRKIQRLRAGFTELPSALAMGAAPEYNTLLGRLIGQDMRAVGLNMNLGPVADLATTLNHPLMAGRVMGDDPARVYQAAAAQVDGMAGRVLGVLKHFPGHGDVTDTHTGPGVLSGTLADLEAREFAAFHPPDGTAEAIFRDAPPAIMLGHIRVPALDPSGLPASLSPSIIGYLRERGYNGLLITDALDMGAIRCCHDLPEAAALAVAAGADMLLTGAHTPNNVQIAMYRAVLQAVQSGAIPAARIEESARRVLMAKAAQGLLAGDLAGEVEPPALPSDQERLEVLRRFYGMAFTVAKDSANLLPLHNAAEPGRAARRLGVIYPNGYPAIRQYCAHEQVPDVAYLPVSFMPQAYERSQAAALAKAVDVLIVFTQNADQIPAQVSLVRALPPEKVVVIALGSPYDVRRFPDVAGYALIYDEVEPALWAACDGVFLGPTVGALPVWISEALPSGSRVRVRDDK